MFFKLHILFFPEKIPNDEKKSKTKIPMLKFKKATREVIEDKKKSKESENEVCINYFISHIHVYNI